MTSGSVERGSLRPTSPGVGAELVGLTRTAGPIALVGIANLSLSITDALLMAALDRRALTAGVVIGDVFSIAIQFSAGALGATAAPIAAAHAAGDAGRVGRTIAEGLRMALVLAVLGSSIIALAPTALLALGVSLPLPDVASEYAGWMAATYAMMMIVALSRSIFPAFGSGMVVVAVIFAAVPLNLVADLVLMHGWLGIPAMGLAGAGLASFLVAVFMASLLLSCMLIAPRLRATGLRQVLLLRDTRLVASALARAALFTGATALCETGVYLSSTVIVAFVAIEAVPAHILIFRTVAVTYVIGTGFGQAVTIHLSRSLASGHRPNLRKAAAIGMALLAAAFFAATLALPALGGLLGVDAQAAAALAPFAAVSVCNLVPAVVAFGILKARTDVGFPSLISFLGYWGVGFTLVILLSGPIGLGAVGVWMGLAAGTSMTAAGLWTYLRTRDSRGIHGLRPV